MLHLCVCVSNSHYWDICMGAKIALVTVDNGDTGAGESDSFAFVPDKGVNEILRS